MIGAELLTTSKHLCSTHLKIKGICSLKALKYKHLQCTRVNTVQCHVQEGDVPPPGVLQPPIHTTLDLPLNYVRGLEVARMSLRAHSLLGLQE